jgi:hypothetical protein
MNHRFAHSSAAGSRRLRRSWRRVLALGVGVLAAAVAAVPTVAMAANTKPMTFKYNVSVKPMALANGSTVVAAGKVTAPEAKVKSWWSASTVRTVVQKGVNAGRQSPYINNGFRCTPTVKGQNTNFVCSLRGADVPTTVTFSYSVVYRGDTASG